MVGTIRVKIAINVNDVFQGVLRCATHVETIPLSLKSVKLMPLTELDRKKVGRSAMLEPLPTKHSSELDINVLHMLLTTMQSALILTDRQGQQYVFRCRSTSAATITPYGGPPKPPPRLNRSLVDIKGQVTHIEESIKSPSTDQLEVDKLAWFRILEKPYDDNSADSLQKACQECIAHNNPTPAYLVTQMISSAILGTADVIDNDEMNRIVSSLWLTLTAIQGRVRDPTRDKQEVLRVIQVQLLLRLQMLAMDATAFLQLYSARLMDRRKRKAGVPTDVMTQIIAIVEQAPFLLDLGKTLRQFLQDTIPPSIYCSIPDQVQEIFDFFECANPFVADDDDDDTHLSSVMEGERNSPPKKKVRIAKESIKLKNDDRILQPMHLTSNLGRRINPLLKDAKGVYVGSHFNTKLANMSAHYHEVQRVPLVRQSPAGGKKSPSKKSKVPAKSALKARNNEHRGSSAQRTARQQSPFARRGRSTTFDMGPVGTKASKKDLCVNETPVKSEKSLAQLFSFIVQEDPSLAATTTCNRVVGETPVKTNKVNQDMFASSEAHAFQNSLFVGETPVKPDNKENRVVPFRSPPAHDYRKPFSVPKNAILREKHQGQSPFEKRTSPFQARHVAQQARAAAGRGKC